MDEDSWVSPLEVLDQLIVHGHDAHEGLRRLERQQQQFSYSDKPGVQQAALSSHWMVIGFFPVQHHLQCLFQSRLRKPKSDPQTSNTGWSADTVPQNRSHCSQSDNGHVSTAGTSPKCPFTG